MDRAEARKAKGRRSAKPLNLEELINSNDLLIAAEGKRGTVAVGEHIASQEKKKAPAKKPAAKKPAAPKKKPAAKKAEPAKKSEAPKTPAKRGRKPLGKLKVIPLGGLDEIGKNMTVFEYENDIIIIDCGLAFPSTDMLGVDLVIPDITYLRKNMEKIRGIFLTHGHEDHIGSLPYVLKEFNVPVYGNKLTLGLVRRKLAEHRMEKTAMLIETAPGSIIERGCFKVEFIKVNHSIPDAAGFAIRTPVGTVLHTGDFKIDTTPIHGRPIDLARIGELGKEGVLLLMADSTNAGRPGMASSEKKVGKALLSIFEGAQDKRIIVASFASNVHRVQQIIDASVKFGRKVAASGRSMEGVIAVAHELGYLKIPKGTLIPLEQVSKYPPHKITLITTGSQGEPMSALYRMAFSDHRTITVNQNDLIIISASPIPGNELLVSRVINELEKLGATVVDNKMADVHVSGHACQEELKLILGLVKPKFFMPVHGEYHHLFSHAKLAIETGMAEDHVFLGANGNVLELSKDAAKITGSVPSGQVMVDGIGVGDVGNIVLRDRRILSQEGIILVVAAINKQTKAVVSGPDIVSRGFIYVRENEDLMGEAQEVVAAALKKSLARGNLEWAALKSDMKDALAHFIMSKTKRAPMIIPIIMDV
ncbi:MAG: ribonuclease J [Clostridia bacterium]|nr:ribonuclease J [Clostridia bacterium]MBQ8893192.1 ribonuclease J [Clostridia bacterium]